MIYYIFRTFLYHFVMENHRKSKLNSLNGLGLSFSCRLVTSKDSASLLWMKILHMLYGPYCMVKDVIWIQTFWKIVEWDPCRLIGSHLPNWSCLSWNDNENNFRCSQIIRTILFISSAGWLLNSLTLVQESRNPVDFALENHL